MNIDTIIFDLDGTITEPFLDFDRIRSDMGIAKDGGSILELLETMPEQEKEKCLEILDRHEKTAVERSTLNDGAKETIEKLRHMSLKIGLLTRNTRQNALAVCEKHGLNFDAIIDRNDGPVKPDAFGVMSLCKQFNTAPARAFVVGDYLHDLLAAKAAGATAVLIANHKNCDQFKEHADFVIHSLRELPELITNCRENK